MILRRNKRFDLFFTAVLLLFAITAPAFFYSISKMSPLFHLALILISVPIILLIMLMTQESIIASPNGIQLKVGKNILHELPMSAITTFSIHHIKIKNFEQHTYRIEAAGYVPLDFYKLTYPIDDVLQLYSYCQQFNPSIQNNMLCAHNESN